MTVGGSQTVTETQAKDSSASGAAASSEPDKGLKMKIKRTNKGTPKNPDGKMEIVSETQQQDSASAANGLGTDLSSGSNPGSPSSTASVEPTGKKSPLLVTKRPAEKSGLAAKERMKMNSSAAKVNSNGSKSGGKSHTNGGGAIVPVTKSFTTPPSAAGGSATASTTTTVNNVNGDSVVNPAMSNRMNSHNSSYNKTREAEEAPTAKRQKVRPNCKENLSLIDQSRIMLSRAIEYVAALCFPPLDIGRRRVHAVSACKEKERGGVESCRRRPLSFRPSLFLFTAVVASRRAIHCATLSVMAAEERESGRRRVTFIGLNNDDDLVEHKGRSSMDARSPMPPPVGLMRGLLN